MVNNSDGDDTITDKRRGHPCYYRAAVRSAELTMADTRYERTKTWKYRSWYCRGAFVFSSDTPRRVMELFA